MSNWINKIIPAFLWATAIVIWINILGRSLKKIIKHHCFPNSTTTRINSYDIKGVQKVTGITGNPSIRISADYIYFDFVTEEKREKAFKSFVKLVHK